MKSLQFIKKVIAFVFVVFSLCFMFQNSSFAETLVYVPDSSTSQSKPISQLDDTEWVITSVPIHPLLPGSDWSVKSEQNGTKLIIKHGDEEVITLVQKASLQ